MSTFAYVAVDARGKEYRGHIDEINPGQALQRLKQMGLFPTSVRAQADKPALPSTPPPSVLLKPREDAFSGRISIHLLTGFTRQLATLIEAGIPLLKGLRSIQEQEESRNLRLLIRDLAQDIEGGAMLSEALGKHPRTFNKLYQNMIVAGETAGMLDSALARLADFMERSRKIRTRIIASTFYPAAVITVAVSILMVLAVWVIPRFREVFAGIAGGQRLPPFTEFVLNSSLLIKAHWWHLILLAAGAIFALRLAQRSRPGAAALDRFKLRLPVLGRIIRKAAIARFARTLGTLLRNGVPVLQALSISRETASNAVFADAIEMAHQRVKEGEGLTPTLRASGAFPSTVISMIDVGEETGALPNMLLKVADTYDDEVDNAISAAMSLLEPALIVFLAVIVGSIVIALFLPLLALMNGGFDPTPSDGS